MPSLPAWLQTPPPTLGLHIDASRVTAVLVDRDGSSATIRGVASSALPDGAVVPSLTGHNVLQSSVVVQAVRGLLRAITRGLRDAILQPDAALDTLAKRDPKIDRTIERARFQNTLDGEMAHPEGQRIGIGDFDEGRLATHIVQMVEGRKLQRVPGILEVFNRDYLPPINERLPKGELLWASVREVLNIFQADACGCDIVTVPHDILNKALKMSGMDLTALSLDTVKMFAGDALGSAHFLRFESGDIGRFLGNAL